MPCPKRIKELQQEDAKEKEIEDGWITTDSANVNSAGVQQVVNIPDIDMDMENIEANQEEQEAVSFVWYSYFAKTQSSLTLSLF